MDLDVSKMKVDKGGMNHKSNNRLTGTKRSENEHKFRATSKNVGLGGNYDEPGVLLLRKMYTCLIEIPEVRSVHIEGLRKEINAGTYKVPVEALAGRLISHFQMYSH
jgi:anti-sigma28 factor (negative regulator of flagellin synthesis)